jgi:MFS transporter, ACS family, glucarate transporter
MRRGGCAPPGAPTPARPPGTASNDPDNCDHRGGGASSRSRITEEIMSQSAGVAALAGTRTRFSIVAMLFFVTAINYADRSTLAIAGPALSKELGINALEMGFVFSAFGWAYLIGQIPGGWLLDRFGSKYVYFVSIFAWSIFTFLQGGVHFAASSVAIYLLFAFRFAVGFAEAPSFPANARIVAAWFPANERGTATAIFNSAQYFATVLFAPLMGWITQQFGWSYVFYFMGLIGIVGSLVWLRVIYNPAEHPRMAAAELDYLRKGGALVDMDGAKPAAVAAAAPVGSTWDCVRQLVASRMMIGIYLAQYCISTLTYFFITWFPVYLVQQRGMSILGAGFVAAIPAICGFVGGVLGGIISDRLLARGFSLTAARKTPIVLGMLMSTTMVFCNYAEAQWLIVAIMAFAFFGKGIGALGWAVISDTAPREIAGLSGGVFNTFGNVSAITTPIIIGYIIQRTGSFDGALVFVGANAIVALLAYLVIVGEIRRLELRSA